MGSAGYINISCIFWVIKKKSVQIIPHRDNYCMKKVIELLITLCADCRRLWLKDKGKEKWKAKTSRLIFLMLIMHKKLLHILVLHFRIKIILTMHFEQNYLTGTPLNLKILPPPKENNISFKKGNIYFMEHFWIWTPNTEKKRCAELFSNVKSIYKWKSVIYLNMKHLHSG